jgi:hypothetical protein
MKRSILLLLLTLMSCTSRAPEKQVTVQLSEGNRSIHILGFDKAVIDDIGRDTATGVWLGLLPVYKMPADSDMKDFQNAQPGKYDVNDNVVIFTPDTPFKKGQIYFIRCYDYGGTKNAWQLVGNGKRPGAAHHRDLTFSY